MTERAMALKRIKKELDDMKKHPMSEIMVGPVDDNLFYWEGLLNGPEDSPYAGGIFKFKIIFTDNYPMKPPRVEFITKMFHPNIATNGEICVSILKRDWSSVQTVSKILLSISSLLTDPNPDSPLNSESARLYLSDRKAYNQTVKQYVKKYASPENLN